MRRSSSPPLSLSFYQYHRHRLSSVMTLSIMLFFFLAILDVTSALENNLHGHQIESDAVLLRDQTNQSTNNHPQQNKLQLLVPQSIPNDEPETANNRKLLDDATKIFKNGELRGSGRRKKQPSKQRRSDVDLDGGISERTSKMNTISILINEVAEDTTRKLEDGLGFGFDYSDDKPQPEIGSASSPPGVGGSGAAGGATNPGYGNYGGYGGGGEYGGAGGGANYGGYGAGGAGGGDYDTGNAGSYGGSSGAAGGYGGGANTAGGVPSTSGYVSYGGAPSANSMDSSGSAAAGGGYGDYGSYGGYGAPSSSSNYGDSYSDSWGAGSASSSFKSKIRIKMKNPFSSKISLLPALFLFFMIALAGMLITAHQMERFPEGTFANCCRVSLGTVTCVYGVIYNLYHCRLGDIPQVVCAADEDDLEEYTDEELERMKLRPGIERALDVEHRKALRKVGIEMNKIKVGGVKGPNGRAAATNSGSIRR